MNLATETIELRKEHLRSDPDSKSAPRKMVCRFAAQWSMLDRLLIANYEFVHRVRSGDISTNVHLINGRVSTEGEAENASPLLGRLHREMDKECREQWNQQFERSQNWLRLTTLAQAYLLWEEHARSAYIELIDFSLIEIHIDKISATVRADVFGDLKNIRHSMWHSSSDDESLGVCRFDACKFKELNKYMVFAKGQPLKVSADALPKIWEHWLFRKIRG